MFKILPETPLFIRMRTSPQHHRHPHPSPCGAKPDPPVAARGGHAGVLRALLEAGASPMAQSHARAGERAGWARETSPGLIQGLPVCSSLVLTMPGVGVRVDPNLPGYGEASGLGGWMGFLHSVLQSVRQAFSGLFLLDCCQSRNATPPPGSVTSFPSCDTEHVTQVPSVRESCGNTVHAGAVRKKNMCAAWVGVGGQRLVGAKTHPLSFMHPTAAYAAYCWRSEGGLTPKFTCIFSGNHKKLC